MKLRCASRLVWRTLGRVSRVGVGFYLAFALFAQLLLGNAPIFAESINTKSAIVRQSDEAWVIDAEFDFTLTTPLETALLRGTPLYFVLDTEITRSRSFWFDEAITTRPSVRRLTYVPLTSTYRVDAGGTVGGGASYSSLDEALRQIRTLRGRELVERRALRNGERYDVSLRLRLDTAQLPKPLQVNTLVSREWTLVSDWYRVVLTP
ncbi:MAG: DUF4390 domain-containing protein [Burkholderiales bacterium]|nr:MAG: DUF4390 domain-containing protein [Burkholderiales bacterium]TAG79682.1 MAG: DUF4390 domain-containing protein [Betaproteobacteria bacterium]